MRKAATVSLLRIGPAGLNEVVRPIRNGPVDIAGAALDAVCRELEPDRRTATVVLAASWKRKRAQLRAQALGCAKTLAAANSRLARWLADAAAIDRDTAVRHAAAEAVALALQKQGRRLVRLPRVYLRDKNPATRVAVLEAITKHPPKSATFLWSMVDRLSRDSSPQVRAATAKLAAISAPRPAAAVELLGRLLQDKKDEVWKAGVDGVALLAPSAATRALDRPLALVVARARTTDALRALKVAQGLELQRPLQQAATHPEIDVRAAAIEALAGGDRKMALRVLESGLRETTLTLRLAALRALARYSKRLGAQSAKLLWRSSYAQDPGERWAAFTALGKVRGKAAIDAAIGLLLGDVDDVSEERRRLTMRALGALARHSPRAAAALVDGAVDPALDVRSEAHDALSEYLGDRADPAKLWSLLEQSERNALLRRMMVAALAHHGRKKGLAALEKRVAGVSDRAPVVTRAAARLALALAKRKTPSGKLIGWLYGW